MTNYDRIDRIAALPREELQALLTSHNGSELEHLFAKARAAREHAYGKAVFLRGLIEFSSYCKNDCYYCGLRCGNQHAERFRLREDEILDCCRLGYSLGIRTFVLQSGEDPYFDDARMVPIVQAIRREFPDCAITLSLGERSRESYQALYDAGANRYLLRHETANPEHYAKLHPANMRLENRLCCLQSLREIGFQVGCGFMVGSPGQSIECLLDDLAFLAEFRPEMVGIGPFLPHSATPFAQMPPGTMEQTLLLLAVTRLLLPNALLPATTALGSAHPQGREKALLAGANVIMPNLSPAGARKQYALYDGKAGTDADIADVFRGLTDCVERAGYEIAVSRGDPPSNHSL